MDLERGYISNLVVEDFKSYRGRHIIGPFSNFTCIIGPNGSGKSNLMDSISFALGLKAGELRAYRLESMIFNYPQRKRNDEMDSKATVELNFVTPEGDEVKFSRSVNMKGHSTYKINGKTVRLKQYIEKLGSYGILVEARNFLIFQGDVEGIASKSPKDMALLLEKVSGSIKYKKEYELLKLKMEQASDEVITTVEKFKGLYTTHNQLKKQSREAKKFRKIEELYERKVLEHVLWRLYHIESEISGVKDDLESKMEERGKVDDNLEEHEKKFKSQQSELAKLKKEYLVKQKDFAKYKKVINARITRLEKISIEEEHLEKEVAKTKRKLKTKKKNWKKKNDVVKQHEIELENVKKQIEEMNAKFDAEKEELEEEFSRLSEEDLVEYRRLKQEANNITAKEQQELATKQDDKERNDQEVSTLRKQLEGVNRQLKSSKRNLKIEKQSEQSLQRSITTIKKEIRKKQGLRSKALENKEHNERTKKQTERELAEIGDQLHNAQSMAESYKRELKINQAVESMKSLFNDCYGRVSNLYEVPRPDRYAVGVSVALGMHHNSIVVGSENVAEECIKYLKQQRVRPMTFIPLDTIRQKRIQERLRDQLGPESKLVVDVILAKDPKFQKALNFVFGNTVVAKDLQTARGLAYGPRRRRDTREIMRDEDEEEEEEEEGDEKGGRTDTRKNRFKIVTFKGSVIHKSGLLTGGDFEELSRRARREQQQRTQASQQDSVDSSSLEQKRDTLTDHMHTTISEIQKCHKEAESILRELDEKNKKLQFTNNDLKFVSSQIKVKTREIANLEKDIKKKEKALASLQERLRRVIREISEQSEEIKKKKARVFEDFDCDVEDIGIYDEKQQELKQKMNEKVSGLELRKNQIQNTLDYEKKNDRLKRELGNLERKIKMDEDKYQNLEEEKAKTVAKVEKVKKTGDKITKRLKDVQEAQRKLEHHLASLDKFRGQAEAQRGQIRQACLALELRLEQLRNRRVDISRKCELREINLPFVDESESQGSSRKRRKIGKDSDASTVDSDDDEEEEEEDDDDEVDVDMTGSRKKRIFFSESFQYHREDKDDDEEDEEEETQEQQRKRKRSELEKEEKKSLDFRSLDRTILNKRGNEYERIEAELQQEIEELKREMAVLAPSVGHTKKQEEAKRKKQESEESMNAAREKAKEAQGKFEEVKEKRFDMFMKTFRPVQKCIDEIYKQLTLSDTFPLGGTAHIGLEDPDEPYLMGIKYNTMPPTKRYRKMEQLSGGEKTLAALALLFSIQYQKPSPFFVLDEIDASLDASNVNKVARYIRNQSDKCQFVVISLKESFYYFADTLVGVMTKDKSSSILTCDLREYDDDDDEEEEMDDSID